MVGTWQPIFTNGFKLCPVHILLFQGVQLGMRWKNCYDHIVLLQRNLLAPVIVLILII